MVAVIYSDHFEWPIKKTKVKDFLTTLEMYPCNSQAGEIVYLPLLPSSCLELRYNTWSSRRILDHVQWKYQLKNVTIDMVGACITDVINLFTSLNSLSLDFLFSWERNKLLCCWSHSILFLHATKLIFI